ncbi:MAG: GntR family transcriptional regulator [Acetivibrionales bacterium]
MENRSSIRDYIYQQLLELFSTGKIAVGERITESQIEKMFSVSRAPVREALVKLCHDNVLTSVPRVGYKLKELTYEDINNVIELRLYIELGSLNNVIERMDKKSLDNLRRLNNKRTDTKQLNSEVWFNWSNNFTFHLALNKIAGNDYVYQVLERSLSINARAYIQLYSYKKVYDAEKRNREYHSRHEEIVSALERHDVFHAHKYLKEDIVHLRDIFSKHRVKKE